MADAMMLAGAHTADGNWKLNIDWKYIDMCSRLSDWLDKDWEIRRLDEG